MDVQLFGNPWEHKRLLSDSARNAVLVDFLERHAPGRRVLEVGCGTGLLSAIAARLGATHVFAVEPTPMADVARELAERNGLAMTVIRGRIEEVEPRPVDVAFSELLNADPFYEGVVEVSRATRPWVVDGGVLAPSRLRVWAALVRASSSAWEARAAAREVRTLGERFDLDVGPVQEVLQRPAPYRYGSDTEMPVGPAALLHDLVLGEADLPGPTEVLLTLEDPGVAGGCMVWFEAVMDDALTMHNAPGSPSHWGRQISVFPEEVAVGRGRGVRVRCAVRGGELHADFMGVEAGCDGV